MVGCFALAHTCAQNQAPAVAVGGFVVSRVNPRALRTPFGVMPAATATAPAARPPRRRPAPPGPKPGRSLRGWQ